MGKQFWIFGGVFGGVGLALLVAAIVAVHSTLSFRAVALAAPGSVVDFDSGKPVVEFVDRDGHSQRVVGAVSSTPPAYELGESVTVRHPPDHPEQARIDGFMESWFAAILLSGMGSIFAAIGAAFVVWEVRKRRLRDWLQQFGTRIQAKYTGVRRDTGMRVNGMHPWRLTAQWQSPVTGLVHSFESDWVFYDPSDYVRRETLDVWIDPKDPSRHHLDATFLPRHAGV